MAWGTSLSLKRSLWIGTALLLCAAMSPPVWAETRAEAFYQEAKIKEFGERDLDAAIALYRRSVEQQDTNRLLSAKARLAMASCYERLGKRDDAKKVYEEIVSESSPPSIEIEQTAKVNFKKIQAQELREQEDADREALLKGEETPSLVVSAPVDHGPQAALSIGPSIVASQGASFERLSIAFRYRLPFKNRLAPLSLEVGLIPPVGASKVEDQTRTLNSQTTDSATLNFHYQARFILLVELPHGRQKTFIPEMGAGVSLVSSDIAYRSSTSGVQTTSASTSKTTWGPYLKVGIHFLPEHTLSYVLDAGYTAVPYPQTVTFAAGPRAQSFNFPTSMWEVGAKLQVKIRWFKRAPKQNS
jgi:hypothetical protein